MIPRFLFLPSIRMQPTRSYPIPHIYPDLASLFYFLYFFYLFFISIPEGHGLAPILQPLFFFCLSLWPTLRVEKKVNHYLSIFSLFFDPPYYHGTARMFKNLSPYIYIWMDLCVSIHLAFIALSWRMILAQGYRQIKRCIFLFFD